MLVAFSIEEMKKLKTCVFLTSHPRFIIFLDSFDWFWENLQNFWPTCRREFCKLLVAHISRLTFNNDMD